MEDVEAKIREAKECLREKRYEQAKRLYTSVLDALLTHLDDGK